MLRSANVSYSTSHHINLLPNPPHQLICLQALRRFHRVSPWLPYTWAGAVKSPNASERKAPQQKVQRGEHTDLSGRLYIVQKVTLYSRAPQSKISVVRLCGCPVSENPIPTVSHRGEVRFGVCPALEEGAHASLGHLLTWLAGQLLRPVMYTAVVLVVATACCDWLADSK